MAHLLVELLPGLLKLGLLVALLVLHPQLLLQSNRLKREWRRKGISWFKVPPHCLTWRQEFTAR